MMTAANTNRKPSQTPVLVNVVDLYAGTWLALSSNGTGFYHVDLRNHTCDCPAGARGFKNCRAGGCRHVLACSTIAQGMRRMNRADRAALLARIHNFRVHVDRIAAEPVAMAKAA